VLSVASHETTSASQADFENVDDVEVAQLLLEVARVKWFDKAKRFGFANIWGSSEDVFVHIEILRSSGLADLQAGGAVAIVSFRGSAVKWRLRYALGKVFRAIRMWFHLAAGVNDGHCNSWMHRFDCRN